MSDDERLTPEEWAIVKRVVEVLAWKRGKRVAPYLGLTCEDFQQAGWTAVMQTIDGYDRGQAGVSAYFSQRISGAMLDLIRSTGDVVRVSRYSALSQRSTVRFTDGAEVLRDIRRKAAPSSALAAIEEADRLDSFFRLIWGVLKPNEALVVRLKLLGASGRQIEDVIGCGHANVSLLYRSAVNKLKSFYGVDHECQMDGNGQRATGRKADDQRSGRPAAPGVAKNGQQVGGRGQAQRVAAAGGKREAGVRGRQTAHP